MQGSTIRSCHAPPRLSMRSPTSSTPGPVCTSSDVPTVPPSCATRISSSVSSIATGPWRSCTSGIRDHEALIEHGDADPAESRLDSDIVSHGVHGPSDVTAVLDLFDRRYRELRGEDEPYSSQDPA